MLAPITKRNDLTDEEFRNHWQDRHAEVIRNTPDSAPTVRRYVQNPVLPEAYPDEDPPYDGVAEVWFDDHQALEGWLNHPYYEETVKPDSKQFVDRENIDRILCQETAMDANPTDTDMIKLYAFLKRKRGLTVQEFARYWRWNHGPRVTSTPQFYEYIRHYVQNHAVHELHREGAAFDGIPVVWFSSLQELETWMNLDDIPKVIHPDEEEFIDRDAMVHLVTHPRPVI